MEQRTERATEPKVVSAEDTGRKINRAYWVSNAIRYCFDCWMLAYAYRHVHVSVVLVMLMLTIAVEAHSHRLYRHLQNQKLLLEALCKVANLRT
jgi:hypothetical protein